MHILFWLQILVASEETQINDTGIFQLKGFIYFTASIQLSKFYFSLLCRRAQNCQCQIQITERMCIWPAFPNCRRRSSFRLVGSIRCNTIELVRWTCMVCSAGKDLTLKIIILSVVENCSGNCCFFMEFIGSPYWEGDQI